MTDIEKKAYEAFPDDGCVNSGLFNQQQAERREGYIKCAEEYEAGKQTLKGILENRPLIQSLINIANDPTIVHKVEQIQGLLFNCLTDDYWDYVTSLSKIHGWAARGTDGLDFFTELPCMSGGVWVTPFNNNYLKLPDEMLPEIKTGSEPVEVELLIRKV